VTEPGAGSDVANLKTTARQDGEDWIINGSKTFITGGMESDYFVIGARTGAPGLAGISLFFVEADTPGFTRTALERKMGWCNYERLGMVASSLGMMKACLEDSIAWAQERETFGKKLISHQVIRHKIADMSAKIDAVQSNIWIMCAQIETGHMPVAEICKAKFSTTKALEFCASEAMQILGGAGYLRGNRIETAYREVKVMAIGGGSEEIMRDLAVRQMGL